MKTLQISLLYFLIASFVKCYEDFSYKMEIKIFSQEFKTLEPINILINTQSLIFDEKLKTQCQDIRFWDPISRVELEFWIERGCDTPKTSIWFIVPSLPSNENSTIEMYYGMNTVSKETVFEGNFLTMFGSNLPCPSGAFLFTAMNGRIPMGGINVGFVGGYENHIHEISSSSHVVGTSSIPSSTFFSDPDIDEEDIMVSQDSHIHNASFSFQYSNNNPPSSTIQFCASSSFLLVTDSVMIFNDTSIFSSGDWSQYSAMNNKFPKGGFPIEVSNDDSTHAHLFVNEIVLANVEAWGYCNGSVTEYNEKKASPFYHYHMISDTEGVDNTAPIPPYIEVIYGISDVDNPIIPNGIISMATEVPPIGWINVPHMNGKFPLGSTSSYGTFGGSMTHSHTYNIIVDSYIGDTEFCVEQDDSTELRSDYGHTHTFSGTTSNTEHIPPYYEVLFIQRLKSIDTIYYGNEIIVCNNDCSGHGICSSPRNCTCEEAYYLDDCSSYKCYGVDHNDYDVCNGHGDCLEPGNNCSCHDGYYGKNCEKYNCYSYSTYSPFVCSGHGSCVDMDKCKCDDGYSDYNCNIHECKGVLNNDTNVCSVHGTCVDIDTCMCNSLYYYDKYCDMWDCYGDPKNDTDACSGHGTCIDRDECQCDDGYWGLNCEYWNCSGITNYDSYQCSGHGACIASDNCTCENENYSGHDCQIWYCGDVINDDYGNVCSGHGVCNDHDDCKCESLFYTGGLCQIWDCFDVINSSPDVCSTHGNCTDKDTCVCDDSKLYSGQNCEDWKCFGIPHINLNEVCSQHGSCVDHNTCKCSPKESFYGEECEKWNCSGIERHDDNVCSGFGKCYLNDTCGCESIYYSGYNCEQWTCFGEANVDYSYVCNGHGDCIAKDECECFGNYSGIECETWTCFSKGRHDPDVCSGHGTCSARDNCTCISSGYGGDDCSQWGCHGVFNLNSSAVCSGHGKCENINNCVCESTRYSEVDCSMWNCYGYQRNEKIVCNGHGSCVDYDECECDENYQEDEDCGIWKCFGEKQDSDLVCSGHGVCNFHNNCTCGDNYKGDDCGEWICFDISNDDDTVCNNKMGVCTDINECSCNANYTGDQCEDYACYGKSHKSRNVCYRNGECANIDTCNCDEKFRAFGRECQEIIEKNGNLNYERTVIIITYEIPIYLINEDEYFDRSCYNLVSNIELLGDSPICRFDTSSGSTTSILEITVQHESHKIGHNTILKLKPVTRKGGDVVDIIIESQADLDVLNTLNFLLTSLWVVVPLSVIFIIFIIIIIIIAAVVVSYFCSYYLKKRKLIKKVEKIKDVELLLDEQLISQEDDTTARLKINKKSFEIDMDSIDLIKIIGRGGADAAVYKCNWGGKVCAFKFFQINDVTSQDKFDQFEQEMNVIASLHHPNILQFYGAALKLPKVGIMLEYCEKGDMIRFLTTYQQDYGKPYFLKGKLRLAHEISSAMWYVHGKDIIHRDLKCQNILVTNSFHAKVMDFGISKIVEDHNKTKTSMIGTAQYMAPEVAKGDDYDEKCDVFSFGIILLEIMTENFAPYGKTARNVHMKVAHNSKFRPKIEDDIFKEIPHIKDLIAKCWDHDATKRPSFKEIMEELNWKDLKDDPRDLRDIMPRGVFPKATTMMKEEFEKRMIKLERELKERNQTIMKMEKKYEGKKKEEKLDDLSFALKEMEDLLKERNKTIQKLGKELAQVTMHGSKHRKRKSIIKLDGDKIDAVIEKEHKKKSALKPPRAPGKLKTDGDDEERGREEEKKPGVIIPRSSSTPPVSLPIKRRTNSVLKRKEEYEEKIKELQQRNEDIDDYVEEMEEKKYVIKRTERELEERLKMVEKQEDIARKRKKLLDERDKELAKLEKEFRKRLMEEDAKRRVELNAKLLVHGKKTLSFRNVKRGDKSGGIGNNLHFVEKKSQIDELEEMIDMKGNDFVGISKKERKKKLKKLMDQVKGEPIPFLIGRKKSIL